MNAIRFRWWGFLSCVLPLLITVAPVTTAAAAGFSRAMREAAEQLGKSGDEVAGAASKMLGKVAGQSDEALEKLAKELGGGGSWRELADAMKRAGIRDADSIAKQFGTADEATRKLLTGIFRNGGKAIEAAVRNGDTAAQAIEKIVKGGPKAMDALRLIDDAAELRECLEGFAKHGDNFPEFVIKGGGENATRFLRKYADEIARAGDEAADDLLKKPAKYFDEFGKPTKEFMERFVKRLPAPWPPKGPRETLAKIWKWTKQTAGEVGRLAVWVIANPITALAWVFTGAWLTGTLGTLLAALGVPPAMIPAVQALLSLTLVGLVINTIAPWLVPLVRWTLSTVLRLCGRVLPGPAGERLTTWADCVPDWKSPIGVSVPRTNKLTIGIVGTKRVGKTTFIVMLAKHLANLVPGASLVPDSDADRKKLADISTDVSQGRPTRDDKTIKLDLTWPFVRGRNPGEGGKTSQMLVLTDFPGEWAAPDAGQDSRKKLLLHLSGVDGLMVVIDPTTLEGDSLRTQMEAVDRLFMRDGIDLGRRFKRALAIVVTKRDAITPELLSKVRRPSRSGAVDEKRIYALATQPELTENESGELGRRMLELLAPNVYESIGGRLESEEAGTTSTDGYFPRRRSKPQLAVFAISQLGRTLGAQVVSYRAKVADWERSGRQGPQPNLALDLDGPDPHEVEIHYPFRWLFDAIPEGLLHQANAMRGWPAARLRVNVHGRFKGAPAVKDDRIVGWKRWGTGATATAAMIALLCLSVGQINAWLARREVASLRSAMVSSAVDPHEVVRLKESLLQSQSDTGLVATLTRFQQVAEGELSASQAVLSTPDRDLDQCLKAAQELGRIASWKREPSWKDEYELLDASVSRIEKPVLSALVDETDEAVTPLERRDAFKEAIDVVSRARGVIPDGISPALATETDNQLERRRQSLESSLAQRDLDEAEERVKTLSGIDAVRCVDLVIVPASVPPSLRARRDDLRSRLIGAYWQQAKTTAETLNAAGKVIEATEVIDGFLAVPEPNPHLPDAQDLKGSLKRNFVKAAVTQAESLLQNDKTDEAWAILDKARVYREAASEATRLAWWQNAVEVKLRQRDYAGAVTLLMKPEPGDEQKLEDQKKRVITEWHDTLLEKVDALVADRKFDEAERAVSQFLEVAGRHATPTLRDDVAKRQRMLVQQRVRDELRTIEAQLKENPLAAFDRAKEISGRVLAEKDGGLQADWVRLAVDGGRKSDNFAEALRTLDRLLPKDAPERQTLDGWWQELGDTMVKRGEMAIADKRYADGWKAFRGAIDETSAPQSFRELVTNAAGKAWQQRLDSLTTSALALCGDRRFQEAEASVDKARREAAPLLETSLPTSQDLDTLAKQVAGRKLSFDVDQACDTGHEPSGEACRRALDRIVDVLGKPGLSDRDRSRVTAAKATLLDHWEDLAYRNLHKLHSDFDFPALADAVREYLSPKAEYRESIDSGRRDRVEELQRWFDTFDAPRDYTITAVGLSGVPAGGLYHWFSRFDPAFRLTATRLVGQTSVVEGQKDSVRGTGDIPPRSRSGPARWAKGDSLRIELWEGAVDSDGHRYGQVIVTSPYALPALVYSSHKVDVTDGDYKAYDFSKLTVQVRVRDWPTLPQLPHP